MRKKYARFTPEKTHGKNAREKGIKPPPNFFFNNHGQQYVR